MTPAAKLAAEALRLSHEMLYALEVQLASWGHKPVVNVRGQMKANAEALASLKAEAAQESESKEPQG